MKTNTKPVTISHNPEKKFIHVCAYCFGIDQKAKNKLSEYNKKWINKGYTMSHGLCTKCAKIYFK